MGMHFGLMAARTSIQRFRESFCRAWPKLEIVATGESFATREAAWAWAESHDQFVSAADWTKENPGRRTYFLWQDGDWAVFLDSSYTLAADRKKVSVLSAELGSVVSFVVETAGGCAFFWCYDKGQLRRHIGNSDGEMSTEGEPLPEEAGIDVGRYYMAETEALWIAFGLTPLEEIPLLHGCQGLCVVDHTDYGAL